MRKKMRFCNWQNMVALECKVVSYIPLQVLVNFVQKRHINYKLLK